VTEIFTKLCERGDVSPGGMKRFDLKEDEVLVVNQEGQFHCLEARCSHAGAPLYEGALKDEVLTCPWHYSQFQIKDGSVLRGPAKKPLQVFRTKIENDQLLAELNRPDDR
jgi:nitrite reductase/ring-hydroxylating ferredoxin subunit